MYGGHVFPGCPPKLFQIHSLFNRSKHCVSIYNSSDLVYNGSVSLDVPLHIPLRSLRTGGYLHVFVHARDSMSDSAKLVTKGGNMLPGHATYVTRITRMMVKKQQWTKLLEGAPISNSTQVQVSSGPKKATEELHLPSILSLSLVWDFTSYRWGGVPPEVATYMVLSENRAHHAPFVFLNDLWLSSDYFVPLGGQEEPLVNATLQLRTTSLFWYRVFLQCQIASTMMKEMGLTEKDLDVVRDLLRRNTPSILLLMVCMHAFLGVFGPGILCGFNILGFLVCQRARQPSIQGGGEVCSVAASCSVLGRLSHTTFSTNFQSQSPDGSKPSQLQGGFLPLQPRSHSWLLLDPPL